MSVKTTLKEFVSILDKAWEGKRAAQMVQFVLYLDLAMILAGLMGLAEWDSRNTPILSNLNFVIIVLASFTVWAAFLTPMASIVFRAFILEMPGLFRLTPSSSQKQPKGYVHIAYYRKIAYRRNDPYMIDYYIMRQKRARDSEAEQRRSGNILFGTALIILFNSFPNIIGIDTTSTLLQEVMALIGLEVYVALSFLLILFFWRATTAAWFDVPFTYIEQPELYRQQQEEAQAESQDKPPYPHDD
tara:strand:+ start:369 stop:1100 length:732 start_codon:yes stop_codon:yes gene_type:complete